MTRYVWPMAVIALAALIVASCGGAPTATQPSALSQASASAAPPLVIGATLPLTGVTAATGEIWRDGTILGAEHINASGGIKGRQVRLIVEDTVSQPAKAVTALDKLAQIDKAVGVVTGSSGAVLAQAPTLERLQVVLLNAAAQAPQMRGLSPYLFSNINDSLVEAADLVAYMKAQGITKAGIVYQDNASGQSNMQSLLDTMRKQGMEVVPALQQSMSNFDYSSLVARLQSINAPAIVFASTWEPTAYALKQAYAAGGITSRYFGLSPSMAPQVVAVAGTKAVEGFVTIRSSFDVGLEQGKTQAFVTAYKARFKAEPDIYAAHFYDAMLLIKAAFESQNEPLNSNALKTGLQRIDASRPFEGVAGRVFFDSGHMVLKPNYIMVVRNGQLQQVK